MAYLPDGRTFEMSHEILRGAIDIHVHPGPHLPSSPRRVDPFEAACEARDVSFGAHSTHYQAMREGHLVDGVRTPLSELYPRFREQELPRCIRIPVDDDPTPELDEILRDVAAHPRVHLNTGHVSPEEALRLVQLAREYGIGQVLVASSVTRVATLEQLLAMADAGAFIEYTLACYTHTTPIPKTHYYVEKAYVSIDEGMTTAPGGGVKAVAEEIRSIGPERCILASDFGVYTLATPVEGLRQFAACMLDLGLAYDDVRTMITRNPARLLGLGPV